MPGNGEGTGVVRPLELEATWGEPAGAGGPENEVCEVGRAYKLSHTFN